MSVPGHTNNPHGRYPGSKNRNTVALQDKCEKLGIDPFETLLLYAKRDHLALGLPEFTERKIKDEIVLERTITPEAQMMAAAKACEYLYPKKKAIALDEQDSKGQKTLRLAYAIPLREEKDEGK
jgi:hypothetical protein